MTSLYKLKTKRYHFSPSRVISVTQALSFNLLFNVTLVFVCMCMCVCVCFLFPYVFLFCFATLQALVIYILNKKNSTVGFQERLPSRKCPLSCCVVAYPLLHWAVGVDVKLFYPPATSFFCTNWRLYKLTDCMVRHR